MGRTSSTNQLEFRKASFGYICYDTVVDIKFGTEPCFVTLLVVRARHVAVSFCHVVCPSVPLVSLSVWGCLQSVDHPVTEQLKDPNGRDMTFEDVMKVNMDAAKQGRMTDALGSEISLSVS